MELSRDCPSTEVHGSAYISGRCMISIPINPLRPLLLLIGPKRGQQNENKKTLEESDWSVCSAPLSYTQSSKILFGMIVFTRKCFPKMPDMFDREDASILRSQKHITIGSFTIWLQL